MPFLRLNLTKTARLSIGQITDTRKKAALINFLNLPKPDILVDIDLAEILQVDESAEGQNHTQEGNDA
ncbi:MAG: hypothetical protein KDJ65_01535 [Anaerolineae bacterium]|nr:hypothetical protein [Anaerolineae bacterium]